MSNLSKIRKLTNQLYPTGRAFFISSGGVKEKYYNAITENEDAVFSDALNIMFSILPDNSNFTTDDATRWEQRLGLITNTLVSLDDRKSAIIRKMNHPGNILARQSRDYIQDSLQLAGFNVFLYENHTELSIEDVLSLNPLLIQLGDAQLGNEQLGDYSTFYANLFQGFQLNDDQLGDGQLNSVFFNKIVNHIDEKLDLLFNYGSNLKCSFFIGGATLGEFADVDINRKEEFRQLILKLKPVQTFGYLLINYV